MIALGGSMLHWAPQPPWQEKRRRHVARSTGRNTSWDAIRARRRQLLPVTMSSSIHHSTSLGPSPDFLGFPGIRLPSLDVHEVATQKLGSSTAVTHPEPSQTSNRHRSASQTGTKPSHRGREYETRRRLGPFASRVPKHRMGKGLLSADQPPLRSRHTVLPQQVSGGGMGSVPVLEMGRCEYCVQWVPSASIKRRPAFCIGEF